ncbi:Uncharacterised protein [uncultured archaeon]|nr:Uncharacterised protein [uncultured archaeon]
MVKAKDIITHGIPAAVGAAGIFAMEYYGISKYWQDVALAKAEVTGQMVGSFQANLEVGMSYVGRGASDALVGFAIPAWLTFSGLEKILGRKY